ncbi:IS4 family transposase [Terracoccus luteus]|uniref:IS4 family transposase n=1 Tax=Terracoccus luteus TaxID=53356 RepID=A0A495XXT4_9MICO|nr:IS1634 family transposase [Terracoccus luteus]RKT79410.1 IS4 family transposase [Terracoccus luteus]
MVFVRKVRTACGATAVQIAERQGGRDRVLEHLGSAHTESELAALVAAARRKVYPGQGELDLSAGAVPAGHAMITSKSSAVLWQVLTSAYTRLGFDAVGDESFKQLVLAPIIEPTSKADSLRVLDEIGVGHASLRTMFRSLARAQERGYRDVIATACFIHAAASGDVSLCLYDVTTLYFEAENEDELRKVGYSKERWVDPQIVVGLLVDRAGFPLEIGCSEGNTAETTTIIPVIRQFQERHSRSDMVVVADAGTLSASNLKDLDAAGLRFIVGSRVTKAPADLASHFRWHGDAFTDGQLIDTITPRVATKTAHAVNDASKRAEPVWDPDVHDRSWRAVWAYSRKRAARDGRTLTLQENRARAVVAGEKAARTPRFVTTKHGTQTLDEASLARARRLAGLKGYVTNIPADVMPASEVIASYHDLWHVEASFRMSKSDLKARPIFHHTRESIEAHLTTVFAALAVARYLQDATGMSIKKIIRTLRPLQLMTLTIAGHEHTAAEPLTEAAREIIAATGTEWPTH